MDDDDEEMSAEDIERFKSNVRRHLRSTASGRALFGGPPAPAVRLEELAALQEWICANLSACPENVAIAVGHDGVELNFIIMQVDGTDLCAGLCGYPDDYDLRSLAAEILRTLVVGWACRPRKVKQ
jgi:hypothetical protein